MWSGGAPGAHSPGVPPAFFSGPSPPFATPLSPSPWGQPPQQLVASPPAAPPNQLAVVSTTPSLTPATPQQQQQLTLPTQTRPHAYHVEVDRVTALAPLGAHAIDELARTRLDEALGFLPADPKDIKSFEDVRHALLRHLEKYDLKRESDSNLPEPKIVIEQTPQFRDWVLT